MMILQKRLHVIVAVIAVLIMSALATANYRRWDRPARIDGCDALRDASPTAIESFRIWPGNRIVVVREGDHAHVYECVAGGALEVMSVPGTPRAEGDALIVARAYDGVSIVRELRGVGDTIRENDPRLSLLPGSSAATAMTAVSRFAGHYEVSSADPSRAPMRDLVLRPDGIFVARHGSDVKPPYLVDSLEYGRWVGVRENDAKLVRMSSVSGGQWTATPDLKGDLILRDSSHKLVFKRVDRR